MDDQAETILVNLLRGPGADGLAGMAPGRRHPLLGLRRRETHALCAEVGLDAGARPQQRRPAFVRNRVRHELLPLCAEVAGRDPVPLLARQAGVLRDEVALLDSLAAEALPDPADARGAAAGPRRPPGCVARAAAPAPPRRTPGETHPPSLAEVERVLAVAAGAADGDRAPRGPAGAPDGRAPPGRAGAAPVVSRR